MFVSDSIVESARPFVEEIFARLTAGSQQNQNRRGDPVGPSLLVNHHTSDESYYTSGIDLRRHTLLIVDTSSDSSGEHEDEDTALRIGDGPITIKVTINEIDYDEYTVEVDPGTDMVLSIYRFTELSDVEGLEDEVAAAFRGEGSPSGLVLFNDDFYIRCD